MSMALHEGKSRKKMVPHLHFGVSPEMPNYLKGTYELLATALGGKISRKKVTQESKKKEKSYSLENTIAKCDNVINRQKLSTPLLVQCREKNGIIARNKLLRNACLLPGKRNCKVGRVSTISPSSFSNILEENIFGELKIGGYQDYSVTDFGNNINKDNSVIYQRTASYYDCITDKYVQQKVPSLYLENYSPYHLKYHRAAKIPKIFYKRDGEFSFQLESTLKLRGPEDFSTERSHHSFICPRYERTLRKNEERHNVSAIVYGSPLLKSKVSSVFQEDSKSRGTVKLPVLKKKAGNFEISQALRDLIKGPNKKCNIGKLISFKHNTVSSKPKILDEILDYEKRQSKETTPLRPYYYHKYELD